MIQCDEVFEILTRGPFPTGAPSDGVVELHLNQCESCRQLALALRPAVELFQEAISPEESRTLPSYSGESGSNLTPWLNAKYAGGSRVAQRSRSLRRRIRPQLALPRWSLQPSARLAAAVVLGMALAGLLRRLGSEEQAPGAPAAVAALGRAHWQLAAEPQHWVVEARLKRACKAEVKGAMLETVAMNGLGAQEPFRQACCTACHKATPGAGATAALAAPPVIQACSACHNASQIE